MTEAEKERIKKAKVKLARFCAYRERTQQEVRNKAFEIGLRSNEVDQLISELISDNFINERRFAKVYVSDKFRLNKWGKLKIIQGLNQRDISERCIKEGLKEIEDQLYLDQIKDLIKKKAATVQEEDPFIKKRKVADYVIRKGYEPDIVWSLVKKTL